MFKTIRVQTKRGIKTITIFVKTESKNEIKKAVKNKMSRIDKNFQIIS